MAWEEPVRHSGALAQNPGTSSLAPSAAAQTYTSPRSLSEGRTKQKCTRTTVNRVELVCVKQKPNGLLVLLGTHHGHRAGHHRTLEPRREAKGPCRHLIPGFLSLNHSLAASRLVRNECGAPFLVLLEHRGPVCSPASLRLSGTNQQRARH